RGDDMHGRLSGDGYLFDRKLPCSADDGVEGGNLSWDHQPSVFAVLAAQSYTRWHCKLRCDAIDAFSDKDYAALIALNCFERGAKGFCVVVVGVARSAEISDRKNS